MVISIPAPVWGRLHGPVHLCIVRSISICPPVGATAGIIQIHGIYAFQFINSRFRAGGGDGQPYEPEANRETDWERYLFVEALSSKSR